MKFKIILFSIVSYIFIFNAHSQQDTITIGTGYDFVVPWGLYCQYSFQQILYKQDQIGRSGKISTISFERSSTGTLLRNLTIYMSHTSKNSIETTADIIDPDSMILVFQGYTYGTPSSAYNQINLTNPFDYNGMDNLMISIIDNTGSGTGPNHRSKKIYNNQWLTMGSHTNPINPNNPVFWNMIISDNWINSQFIFVPDTNSCLTPNITTNNLTFNSCELKWDSLSCCNLWEFKFRRFGASDWENVGLVDTNSLVFDTLNMNSKYEVLVRNIYAPGSFSNWNLYSFTTPCGPCTQLPIKENYDQVHNLSVYPPNCWTILNINDSFYHTGLGTYSPSHSSPNSLEIGSNEYLISPHIEENLSSLGIRFRYYFFDNTPSTIQIGSIFDTLNSNQFFPIDTIPFVDCEGHFRDYYLSLAAAPINMHRIAIKPTGLIYIDDIEINYLSNCDAVIYPQIDTITAHTCEFSWQALNNEVEWEICYSKRPFNPDTSTFHLTSYTNSFTLTNLLRDTTYFVFVRSKCDSSHYSNWSDTIIFRTLFADCMNPSQFHIVPNSVTAHSGQIAWTPMGNETTWEICYHNFPFYNPDIQGTKLIVHSPGYTFTNLPNEERRYVYVRSVCDSLEKSEWQGYLYFETLFSDCPTPTNVIAVTDSITSTSALIKWNKLPNVQEYQVIYDSIFFSPSNPYTAISVATSDTSIWITGLRKNSKYYLFVRAKCDSDTISNWSTKLNFYTLFSNCKKPYNISSEVIEDSIYVHWSNQGNVCQYYDIEYGEKTFETYFNQCSITETFLTIPINPNISDWYIKVRAVCSEDESDWIRDSINFCPIKSTIPFYEDFSVGVLTSYYFQHCWWNHSIVNQNEISIIESRPNISTYNGSRMLFWDSYSYQNGSLSRFVSSPISTKNFTNLNYRFAWYVTTIYPTKDDGMTIQYSFDCINWHDASAFIDRRASVNYYSNNQWIIKQDSLPAAIWNKDSVYIGLLFKSAFGESCYLDNFSIDGTYHECNPPSEVNFEMEQDGVLVSWNSDGDPNSLWEIKYKKTSEAQYGFIQQTDTFLLLDQLTPNTNYHLRIRKICSGDFESVFSKRYTFNSSGQSNIDFESNITEEISIYPNPSSQNFEIQSPNGIIKSIELYGSNGSFLKSYKVDNHHYAINLKDKSPGFYIIKIIFDNHKTISKKIIKI